MTITDFERTKGLLDLLGVDHTVESHEWGVRICLTVPDGYARLSAKLMGETGARVDVNFSEDGTFQNIGAWGSGAETRPTS